MSPADRKTDPSASNEGPLIMIVDDDKSLLRLLGMYLMSAGYRVYPVSSGEAALEALGDTLPNLIMLDVQMGGIDGFETFRKIRENPILVDVPVLFLTSMSDPVSQIRGFLSDAEDYLLKSTPKEKILARVEMVLKRTQCKLPGKE